MLLRLIYCQIDGINGYLSTILSPWFSNLQGLDLEDLSCELENSMLRAVNRIGQEALPSRGVPFVHR